MKSKPFRYRQQVAGRYGNIFRIGPAGCLTQQTPFIAAIIHPSQAEFAISAAEIGVDDNSFPHLPICDALTKGSNFSGAICTRNVWEVQFQTRPTPANPKIEMVQGGCLQAHQHLAGLRLRLRAVAVFQNFDISVVGNKNSFHKITLSLG